METRRPEEPFTVTLDGFVGSILLLTLNAALLFGGFI